MRVVLLVMVAAFLVSCSGVGGEDMVWISRADMDRQMRGSITAGWYQACIQRAPLAVCRGEMDKSMALPQMTEEERREYIQGAQAFVDSIYDDVEGLEYSEWEDTVLNR